MDPKKKFFLFKQSNNFCSVPWNHIKVDMTGNIYTCVAGKEKLGDLSIPLDQVLTSEKLKSIREELVNNTVPGNCTGCRSLENNDYLYVRGLYNPMFQSSTVNYTDNSAFTLSGLDLHWGSTCNLKCITCWSKQSSSIAQEEGMPILNTPTEQADKLIEHIVQHQTTIKEIYLSGGEPTLIKHNLRLLKQLRKDLNFRIRINTNMMFESDNQIINELKKFPDVMFTISVDEMNERYDYIRRGASWDKFIYNLKELQKLHFKWRVNTVFFVGSAMNLAKTQQHFIDNYNINDFTINQLSMGHTNIRARNLSDSAKEQCLVSLKEHQNLHSGNKNLCGGIDNCIRELTHAQDEDYREFFDNVDRKAGTNWRELFTELV